MEKIPSSVQKGQILLIVVLVLVIALTIGLSVVTRTITNVKTTSEQENSQRAFSAAEAGIEKSLSTGQSQSLSPLGNASFTTSLSALTGTEILLNNGASVLKDEGVDVWLSDYPSYTNPWSGNLSILWGSSSDVCPNVAAIEIVTLTGTVYNSGITHDVYDPCGPRTPFNHFNNASVPNGAANATISGKIFSYLAPSTPYQFAPNVLLLRVIPLYASTQIAIRANPSLPSQGTIVTATGTSNTATRKIVTFQSYPRLPIELFPFAIFSPK